MTSCGRIVTSAWKAEVQMTIYGRLNAPYIIVSRDGPFPTFSRRFATLLSLNDMLRYACPTIIQSKQASSNRHKFLLLIPQ